MPESEIHHSHTEAAALALSARVITHALAMTVALLACAGVLAQWIRFSPGRPLEFVYLFDMNREANVPTLVSSLLLALAALLFGLCAVRASRERTRRYGWVLLALGFTWMTFDETVRLHERLNGPVGALLGPEAPRFLHFGWVLPALILLPVLGGVLFRFWWRLPSTTKRGLALAGVIYVSGAVGMEMVGASWAAVHGLENEIYGLMTTVEETLEFSGVVLCIHTLLQQLATPPGFTLRLTR